MAVAEVETSTAEPVRDAFQAAYRAAKETVAAETTAVVDEPVTDEGDTTTETTVDTKPATKPAEPAAVADPVPAKGETPESLLSEDEFSALQTKHADDPAALRKSLEAAFTQKTQRLAAERHSYERLKDYAPLIDAYEADPEGTLARLAETAGFALTPKGERATTTAATTTTADTAIAVDAVLADFRTSLGPDLEYLADGLAPAITKLVQNLTQSTVEKNVEPLRAQTQGLLTKVAQEQTDALMAGFTTRHPDWKAHEPAMMALSRRLTADGTQPIQMTETEFLDHLYATVTNTPDVFQSRVEREVAAQVKKHIEKLNAGGQTETRVPATPESEVRRRPSGPVDFHKAAADAIAGIRYVD